MQAIRSFETADTPDITKAVKSALRDNSVSIDAIFVIAQGDTVMLGEYPKDPGSTTLFQTDLGIVRWNTVPDFLERAKGTFLAHFAVKTGSPVLYPVMAEKHTSFDGRRKLLVYLGVTLEGSHIEPRPDTQFQKTFWATAKPDVGWYDHFAYLRTSEKQSWHVQAIEKALRIQVPLLMAA